MKKSLQIIAALFCGLSAGFAQQLAMPEPIEAFIEFPYSVASPDMAVVNSARANCPNDTVYYTWQKNVRPGTVSGFNLVDTIGYPRTLTQWFEGPQPITISGMRFLARANPGLTQTVTLNVFNSGPDSLPMGAAIASATMLLDDALAWRNINFNNPVTVTGHYCLAISTTSN
nr:hypothetical protein [Bacteroidota bacterium]